MKLPVRFVRFFSTSLLHKPKLELLNNRCLLKMKGEALLEYCQGLMTNDILQLETKNSLYTMLLNSKGRVLYDCFLYKIDNFILLECDSSIANNLQKHLKMFMLRKKIEIDVLHNAFVWVLFCSTPINIPLDSQNTFDDPRLPFLGKRIISDRYFNMDDKLLLDNQDNTFSYQKWRYTNGVAEGLELLNGISLPLEMNCDYLNGVSFDKGCYIGQELTARTHHTGVIRKRIMPIVFKNAPHKLNIDADIYDNDGIKPKKPLGRLRGICENIGIALLRIDECLKSKNLVADGHDFKTFIPSWWKS
ncbi:putative transferase CAF17 homolog, mitochondrial isoform X1 [Daktulosphaira vitifoliae]|uniref:putative transferase CAF17 homolog, mitochondrial isoform X1 n=1 Tax=Daktulosphaira vitifoliae TaxID=58002 RepID=UPI0021AA9103|nr:putative transferase CAF17 homolog, mitochondrial isoform X1 [Daktulosphaira vitifoliae]